MLIVNKKTFLAMPEGTIFAYYNPIVFEGLHVKGETISQFSDFYYQDLIGNIESTGSDDYFDKCNEAEEKNTRLKLDFECLDRDGMYDDDQLYAVYDLVDIAGLLRAILGAVNESDKLELRAII